MKKIIFCLISMFIFIPNIKAADYSITVDHSFTTSANSSIIFNEQNIGPGFRKTYSIKLDNKTSSILAYDVEQITISNSDIIIEKMDFIFKNNNETILSQGIYSDFNNNYITCNNPKEIDEIKLDLYFDKNATNKYQDKSFKINIDFKIYEKKECIKEEVTVNKPTLPDTGESIIFFIVIGTIISISLLGIIILVILIKKDKNKEEVDK